MQMIEQRFSLFCVFTQESAFFSNVRPFFRVSRIVHGYFMGGGGLEEKRDGPFGGDPQSGTICHAQNWRGGEIEKGDILGSPHETESAPISLPRL